MARLLRRLVSHRRFPVLDGLTTRLRKRGFRLCCAAGMAALAIVSATLFGCSWRVHLRFVSQIAYQIETWGWTSVTHAPARLILHEPSVWLALASAVGVQLLLLSGRAREGGALVVTLLLSLLLSFWSIGLGVDALLLDPSSLLGGESDLVECVWEWSPPCGIHR